jgi:hypothetical protein
VEIFRIIQKREENSLEKSGKEEGKRDPREPLLSPPLINTELKTK